MITAADSTVARRSTIGTIAFAIVIWLLIFPLAGTLSLWQGWLFWLNYCGWSAWIMWYFLQHDPALIERRQLPGYTEYCAKVRYRLLPGVW